jgi:hypothetical protein
MTWYCNKDFCQSQLYVDVRNWQIEQGYDPDAGEEVVEVEGSKGSPLARQGGGHVLPMPPAMGATMRGDDDA